MLLAEGRGMSHKHKKTFYPVGATKSKEWKAVHKPAAQDIPAQGARPELEIVLKCDSAGSVEAVTAAILNMPLHEVEISIIHSGIGDINKSDILLAETGSRLIAGFQVGASPDIERELREHSVEARLYDVIYKLTDDIRSIVEGIVPHAAREETIIGNARVIALFKSSRKGIILGCEVLEGHLAVGQHFRIISAIGPVYSGAIASMHIGENIVQKANAGQQAGIKIQDFNKVKIGDLVESYRASASKKTPVWQPRGGVVKNFS
jgi:translation initiation factor IF-2